LALPPGTRLGVYEVTVQIGVGGMGEVYRARDTQLNRDVALKVLPELFASDPERLARFTREAHTLASLNHPNIAAIYGIEASRDVRALVMELVEGEDLSQRTARGAIPLDEALPIAKQITDALEAAHEQGIIHRDLKPANIKVRADGTVKVLDFGLAKLVEAPGAGSSAAGLSQSPTITSPAMMTGIGMLLGTAAYMSPEQARGKVADRRADIWAFGCVVFEMLSGQRTFKGELISDVLASVLKTDPDWQALPVDTPAALRRLLRRCLEKDPKRRLQAIGEARVQIEDLVSGSSDDTDRSAMAAASPRWRALPWALAALAVGGLAVALIRGGAPPAPAGHLSRFVIRTASDAPLQSYAQPDVTISPDGLRVVYRSARDTDPGLTGLLYIRALDQFDAVPLRGTDGAVGPVFSRDGAWIVYQDGRDNTLKRISALGGSPVTICSLDGGALRGASWGPDDTIVFATDQSKGLLRVPAAGGKPERVTTVHPATGEIGHFWPQVLPDGRAVLFTSWGGSLERARVAVVSPPGGEVHSLLDGTSARFSPTGHLIFAAADSTLRAVGFDARRWQVIGNPVTVVERVGIERTGGADFALADDGSLVYATEASVFTTLRTLVWVDRAGHEEPLDVPLKHYTYARLSPDGTRVALDARDEPPDIWIWDLAHHILQRLTNDPGPNRGPIWTPDGRRVAFTAERDGVESVYWQPFDGSGSMERLSSGTQAQNPMSFSPDGTQLIVATPISPPFDLGVITLGANRTTTMLLHSTASEANGVLSTDGHWLALESDESGRSEIYVRPFPNVEKRRIQVSTGGGSRPLWSRTGRELFYYVAPDTIMAVSVRLGEDIALGSPQPVVKGRYAEAFNAGRHYDVSLDGQRFLLLKDASDGQKTAAREIHLVLHWFEALKAKAPTK
jgi:serine/threonine-protein kinase